MSGAAENVKELVGRIVTMSYGNVIRIGIISKEDLIEFTIFFLHCCALTRNPVAQPQERG
jgi:hypothetical protein